MINFSDADMIKLLGKFDKDEIESIINYFDGYEQLKEKCEEIIENYVEAEKLMYAIWEYYQEIK